MRRLLSLLITFLSYLSGIHAQPTPVYSIDAHADTLKKADFPDLYDLADRLVEPARTEREKVRAIFYWVAKNIRYDYPGLRSNTWNLFSMNKVLAQATYERGMGICGGYAMLMSAMLDRAGIENTIVSGWAKGETVPLPDSSVNHAWNAVRIDSAWHLLDATWASPKKAGGEIDNFYFLPAPERLIASHFPEDEKWTLLERKVSREEFKRLPEVSSLFYEMGFGTAPPVVEQTPGRIRFNLQLPDKMIIGFILWNKVTQELTDAPFKIEKGEQGSTVTVEVPREGDYSVEMTAMWDKYPYRKSFGIIVVE